MRRTAAITAGGVDAIAHMGRVLVRLEQFDRETLTERVHPLCGRASLHASLITRRHRAFHVS